MCIRDSLITTETDTDMATTAIKVDSVIKEAVLILRSEMLKEFPIVQVLEIPTIIILDSGQIH